MFSEERKEKILEILDRKKSVKVSELSKFLKISEVTVRKDLDELHGARKLCRTHGGALILNHGQYELPWQGPESLRMEEKRRIARRAIQYVCDNEAIILDDSSTVLELAKLLAAGDYENLTVVTTAIPAVNVLLTNRKLNVVIAGGPIMKQTNAVLGSMAVRMFRSMRADKCFMGTDSIHRDGVYMAGSFPEMFIKQAMLEASRQNFVLADHTKFEKPSFLKVGGLTGHTDWLITDKRLDDFDYSIIEKRANLDIAE
ncbi:MAG: DeoR/GlpR transcriptional regulator [Lachnospiraceae bacterium]|nr:DeoR/GlpR transcriptional regulator [Lachnospiraceae bacterium]